MSGYGGPPPGWYPSPDGAPGALRWWDGRSWTLDMWTPPPPRADASWAAHEAAGQASSSPSAAVDYGNQAYQAYPAYGGGIAIEPPRRRSPVVDAALWTALAIGLAVLWFQFMGPHAGPDVPHTGAVALNNAAPSAVMHGGSLDNAEAYLRSLAVEADEGGSYLPAAETMVRAFGAEFTWTSYAAYSACDTGDGDHSTVAAFYCDAEPWSIHLNSQNPIYPEYTYSPEFLTTVRHELGHLAIHERCGFTGETLGGQSAEGVTSSYAVLYLGADREDLARDAEFFPEYTMSARTDEVAMDIHAGRCD